MTTLSLKSDEEISDLLNEYGIKHGPIVGSTRGLYVKKLKEAMAKDMPLKASPDKTYYREEEEEVTYVYRRVPLRSEAVVDSGRSYTTTTKYRELEDDDGDHGRSYTTTTKYRELEDDDGDHGRSYTTTTKYRELEDFDGDHGRSYTSTTTKYRELEDDDGDHGRSYTTTTKYRELEDFDGDHGRSYTSTTKYREPEDDDEDQPALYRSEATHRYVTKSKPPPLRSASAATQKESSSRSGRLIPLWFQFLVFLVVAGFLYYVFTSMETTEMNPFKRVE